jgi:hypothetical protein
LIVSLTQKGRRETLQDFSDLNLES